MAKPKYEFHESPTLDADGVARAFGVSRRTVFRLRARGEIPAPVRIGRGSVVRWRRADIERYLNGLDAR